MEDLGVAISYLVLKRGTPVYSRDGERLGRVTRVLGDRPTHIFDGIIFDTSAGPGGHRFVDAPDVGEFRERAVILRITGADAEQLPEPSANPAVMQHGGEEDAERPLTQKLRRAWDLISGRY
jgi:hypothetical protein